MPGGKWQLFRTNALGEWALVGSHESLAAAARRIIEIEAVPERSIAFQMHVGTNDESDADALSHLEYQGKHGVYVIKAQTP